MGREIELKLAIDPEEGAPLLSSPVVSRYAENEPVTKRLYNIYYDTPGQDLRKNRMALRVRRDGDCFIQTLKQRGISKNGLTERGEWEWLLSGQALDLSLVPSGLLSEALKDSGELIPLFTTDFKRALRLLALPAGALSSSQKGARIEIAFDLGEIFAASKPTKAYISEVELELLEGDPETLHLLAEELGKFARLVPSDISKAARGYRLYSRGG